jgi:hypothetical protein
VVSAHAEDVLKFQLRHMATLLRLWQRQLSPTELTLEHYADRLEDMRESDDPRAIGMPTADALQRMLDDASVTLAGVTGGVVAAECPRDSATPTRERKTPPGPAGTWSPPGGWMTFLAEWGFNPSLVGLIDERCIARTLELRKVDWSAVSDGLEADATARARVESLGPRRFFEPSRVVQFLVERRLIAASEASRVLAELLADH